MLSEAKHLFAIPIFISFVKGDRGASLRAPPITCLNRKCFAFAIRLSLCAKRCLTIPQTPSRLLIVRCTCICHSPQRFVYVNMRT